MKYSDCMAEWLRELGYTHCFFVAGGNIMHLLESFSRKLDCRAVIHEVAAGIAAEYFNEIGDGRKAVALATAGPGLTNIVTAMAGAFLESRELLVIGGQAKTADLANGQVRQRGIQEIDGVSIVKSVCVASCRLDAPVDRATFSELVGKGHAARKGPVFLEVPLDIQGRDFVASTAPAAAVTTRRPALEAISDTALAELADRIRAASRPVLLLGGGISRETATAERLALGRAGIPVATTWNGADRMDATDPVFIGRPNTWGQRSANLIIQQADLVVALGTRLGLQQTGFNWQQFVPVGDVVQVDIDQAELDKGHPRVATAICADANDVLRRLLGANLGSHQAWLGFAREIRELIPLIEPVNKSGAEYVSPYVFVDRLSDLCDENDIVIPCSSGSAFTVMMQTFRQKSGQRIVTNKGLASMGYGLSGAIGAALAYPEKRVILVEGDGGFAQNIQEIGTARVNNLNLKMFVFDDSGYASIRMTQRSYFGGRYIGCDTGTGLGLPDWERLFAVWDVPVRRIGPNYEQDGDFLRRFAEPGPAAFVVSIDPEQTYFPKITSRITDAGTMESNPLHRMTPDLAPGLLARVYKFY